MRSEGKTEVFLWWADLCELGSLALNVSDIQVWPLCKNLGGGKYGLGTIRVLSA
jgi:hypothetical protein